jgi:hypothetical protein
MSSCTNCKSNKRLKLIKLMTYKEAKRKLELKLKHKMEWNSIGIKCENHEKKKVRDCGQRDKTKRLG